MATAEQPRRVEQSRVPEQPRFTQGLVGLQGRLLLGGAALNPENELALVTKEALGSFEGRDYRLFNRASTGERRAWWQGKENNDFARQKQAWVAQVTRVFEGHKDFFAHDAKGKRWNTLFKKLGADELTIDAAAFTQEQAKGLYERYFGNQHVDVQGGIKQFIKDVRTAYRRDYGNGYYEQLKQDLDGIVWLGNIFGDKSAQITAQLADAEAKLATQPDRLIAEANEGNRINTLVPEEKSLLRFLRESTDSGQTQTDPQREEHLRRWRATRRKKTPQEYFDTETPLSPPKGYRWEYHRLGEPRVYPRETEVEQILHPQFVAQELKKLNPEKYGTIPLAILTQEIAQEQQQLNTRLAAIGLHSERYMQRLVENLSRYRNFLQHEYGLRVPDIQRLTPFPISGKTAEYYNTGRQAFALVHTHSPVIFLDMERIAGYAHELGIREWQQAPNQTLDRLMERLLNEIEPHEYTHLISDLAFWRLYKQTPEGEEIVSVLPAKAGVDAIKPGRVVTENGTVFTNGIVARGGKLTEAITTELTNQWAKIDWKGQPLDINAYAKEREVLWELVDLLKNGQHISRDEAFKKFVYAYFNPKDFRKLARELSASRPHFLSIVYALMEHDGKRAENRQQPTEYDLTKAYIRNELSHVQKRQITDMLAMLDEHDRQKRVGGRVFLPPIARKTLREQLGFSDQQELPRAA